MEIKEIKIIMDNSLSNLEDDEKAVAYGNAVACYLSERKPDTDIVSLVINGMDIDHGSNFYDYLKDLSRQELQSLWKIIKANKMLENPNGLKLIAGMFYMALIHEGNMESLMSNIIVKLYEMLLSEKTRISKLSASPILIDYIFNELPDNVKFTEWAAIKVEPEKGKQFAEYLLKIIKTEPESKGQRLFARWLNDGIRFFSEKIERKKIEAKIPESKLNNIKDILNHYDSVEKQLRSSVYDNARLEKLNECQQEEISTLKKEMMELQQQLKDKGALVVEMQEKLKSAEREIEERKKLNEVQVQYREDTVISLLQDIANALKAEYSDYVATKNQPMDEMLGEIYKEKLSNIFKILNSKGIKVEI